MIHPPRLGIVILFSFVLLGAGGFAVYSGGQRILSAREAATVKRAQAPPKIVFAIQDEGAETANKPLHEVIRGLDFDHDPKALLTFDLAMQTRLRRRHYEELDACAADLERSRARFPGGGWELYRMLDMLSNCPGGRDGPEVEWGAHLSLFRDWIAHRPDSCTAREALSGALIDYAWKARGEGFARTVTDEGWRLHSERLQQAGAVLGDLPPHSHRSPMWYYNRLVIARGLSLPRVEYDRIFNAGVRQEPGFFGLYTEKAYDLLPRWDGEPGEWERFATEASDRTGGSRGDILYFFIVRAQCESIGDKVVLADGDVDWGRVKRGWVALCAAFGTTNNNLNEYCLMAGMKGDRDETVAMLARIGDKWDPWVWKKRSTFTDFQDWAFRRGPYAADAGLRAWIPKQ